MNYSELEKKHNIVYIKGNRHYKIDLNKIELNLWNTIPTYFKYDDIEIFSNTWKKMLIKITTELYGKFSKNKEFLLSIESNWGKQKIFSEEKRTNFYECCGLYINCGQGAVHSMWTVQLILNSFKINLDECIFILKRQPIAEPLEVKEYIINDNVNRFKEFLQYKKYSDLAIDNVIKYLYFIQDKFLKKISVGYSEIFLIEERNIFISYLSKIKKIINVDERLTEKQRRILLKVNDILDDFNIELNKFNKERHKSFFNESRQDYEDEILNLLIEEIL